MKTAMAGVALALVASLSSACAKQTFQEAPGRTVTVYERQAQPRTPALADSAAHAGAAGQPSNAGANPLRPEGPANVEN